MAEYFLNNKSLSDFGIYPTRNGKEYLSITGGFDLPKRIGTTHYSWPLQNSVEPFVDSDDIEFNERELKFTGAVLGNVNSSIATLNAYIDTLPELFPLSCKWGTWQVKLSKQINITPIDKDNSTIVMTFSEPLPDLSGVLPSPAAKKNIDDYDWFSFGLLLESISGGQDIGEFKNLSVTQNPAGSLSSKGEREKTEITINANMICDSFNDFDTKRKSLYPLFGGSGLRKIKYRGAEYTCFAVDGFKISDIFIRGQVWVKFQCKLIVTNKTII